MEKLADLHVHTDRGDGVLAVAEVVKQAKDLGLSAVAITDHDQTAPRVKTLGLEVVPGVEVTAAGFRHILGLYVQKGIPSGLSVFETVKRIHDEGGLAVAAHPLIPVWPASLKATEILAVADNSDPEVYWDGFEIGRIWPGQARKFFDQYLKNRGVAEVAGSDAHFRSLGQVVTVYEGDLREAIMAQKTRVQITGRPEIASPGDYFLNLFRAMVREPVRRKKLFF